MHEMDYFASSTKRSLDERRHAIKEVGIRQTPTVDFLNYGFDYFDNHDYGVGYGGYRYDGRYADAAHQLVDAFGLKEGDSILEIGCAKGYILYEFQQLGMHVTGLDASTYAIAHAKEEIRDKIILNSNACLPFTDGSFDFVLAKEVIPHLEASQALKLVSECMRVTKDKTKLFLELQCAETDESAAMMKTWDVTHLTIKPSRWWVSQLRQLGFAGTYHCKPLF